MDVDEYKMDDTYMLEGNKFPPLRRKYNRRSRGYSHKNNNFLSQDEFFIKLKHHFIHSLSDLPNF